MLFVNRWIVSLLVALVVLDGGVQAYRYFRKMGNRFQPVMMKPVPVGRFGFVRAENPNADGAMDAKSGEESSESAAPATDVMQGHEMHAPEMREMIHDSPHPVEIDMGPGMEARIMGFEGELDGEGNFGRAGDGAEEEEEEGAQFRHFKHKKHKKHKFVIHTHHHYHHKKEGGGYGHHGYGKHDSYGHHGHGGGHHGYGGGYGHHGGDDGDDDYEPTYGHHGRYRRSSMSEMSPPEGQTPDAQALDRTALTHSSPELPNPMETSAADPSTPTVYRQSVSRRQLVRSKNERLAQIGRDRAQRANSSPQESIVRAVRNLIFDRNNPRMMDPFGGKKPTDSATDRRRQRQDLRRRMHNKPETRPIEAFKNAITSIRQRVMPTTTTPAPPTLPNKRQRAGRTRRTKSGGGMVAAPLVTAAPAPPPVPAPIDCAECRRLCNARGRARSRPLNAQRRAGSGAMVAAPTDGGIVASAGPAAGPPLGNLWNSFFGSNVNSDGMVASAGPEAQGPKMWDNLVQFFTLPEPGMVSSAKGQDGTGLNFWNLFLESHEESVGAARKYGDENLPYCEDIAG